MVESNEVLVSGFKAIYARSFPRPSNLPLVAVLIEFSSTLYDRPWLRLHLATVSAKPCRKGQGYMWLKCEVLLLVGCTPNALKITSLNQQSSGRYG